VPAYGQRLPSRLQKGKPQEIKASPSSWARMLIVWPLLSPRKVRSLLQAKGSRGWEVGREVGESQLMVNNDK